MPEPIPQHCLERRGHVWKTGDEWIENCIPKAGLNIGYDNNDIGDRQESPRQRKDHLCRLWRAPVDLIEDNHKSVRGSCQFLDVTFPIDAWKRRCLLDVNAIAPILQPQANSRGYSEEPEARSWYCQPTEWEQNCGGSQQLPVDREIKVVFSLIAPCIEYDNLQARSARSPEQQVNQGALAASPGSAQSICSGRPVISSRRKPLDGFERHSLGWESVEIGQCL